MSIPFIDLKSQYERLKPKIQSRIEIVLNHGQYIMGPEIEELEEKLAEYVGVRHCITVANGTDALLVALMALGVTVGDEVITTPFTFVATGEMIALLGAKPVFVDIDPRTYNLDPALLESAITKKTKAIIPVSLYGQCADFDAINMIANAYSLPVIEDAAQSFGATYKGRKSCGLSSIGCTSFFPSKPLGCYGDGGACFTNDRELALKMRSIRTHGQEKRYHHTLLGINSRLDTLQAAILLAKMEILDQEIELRSNIAYKYGNLLSCNTDSKVQECIKPYIEPHNTSVYAQYTVQVEDRELVQKKLIESGIPTTVHYPIPLHLQPIFAELGLAEGSYPISEKCAKRVLSLPMHPYISEESQYKIVNAIKDTKL